MKILKSEYIVANKNNQGPGATNIIQNNTNNTNTKLSLTEKGPAQISLSNLIIKSFYPLP